MFESKQQRHRLVGATAYICVFEADVPRTTGSNACHTFVTRKAAARSACSHFPWTALVAEGGASSTIAVFVVRARAGHAMRRHVWQALHMCVHMSA